MGSFLMSFLFGEAKMATLCSLYYCAVRNNSTVFLSFCIGLNTTQD